MTQLYSQELRKVGLEPTQFTLLLALSRVGEITQGGLGARHAIDSTTLRGWSNGGRRGKRGKRHAVKRQRSRPGRVSDGDAGWSVKSDTHGRKKYTWGYKCHIISDADSELPIAISVTAGNVADVREASGLLRQIRYSLPRKPDSHG
ncbi:MAG: transposase [Acidobacteria bacterium]|nr:transposase [Acidobacteriota bacterium]